MNGGVIDALDGHPAIELGTHLRPGAVAGTFEFESDLLGAKASEGILLVGGGKDENNYALSQADLSGNPPRESFIIYVHDNGAQGAAYETDPFTFLYLPVTHSNPQIPAMGRIRGDGATLVGAGSFTVNREAAGVWRLRIPGHSSRTGTLLISPEGGEPNNVDNIVSYQADAGGWVIESRDLFQDGVGNPQELGLEAAFSFAFVTAPRGEVVYVARGAGPGGDGTSWGRAYADLQTALANAAAGQEVWVAAGTYYPDEGAGQTDGDRASTFAIPDGVKVFGGFAGNESSPAERVPGNPTILSGDIGVPDDRSDNCYHVLFSNAAGPALLDGLTITGGQADGDSAIEENGIFAVPYYGGGLLTQGGHGPWVERCRFVGNFAEHGGAVFADRANPVFESCLFLGNRADLGGAVYLVFSKCGFGNCTFTGNASSLGGALFCSRFADVEIANSILWNNTASDRTLPTSVALQNANDTVRPRIASSIVEGSGGSGDWNAYAGEDGGNNLDADPLFATPADPAGAPSTTGDPTPAAGSPALDSGDNATAQGTADLNFAPRLQNGTVDRGAIEP